VVGKGVGRVVSASPVIAYPAGWRGRGEKKEDILQKLISLATASSR
jgi:hypothetical protein